MEHTNKLAKSILIGWGWVETLRMFLFGAGLYIDREAQLLPTFDIHKQIMPLKIWGIIMVIFSIVMAVMLLRKNILLLRVVLIFSSMFTVAWASCFVFVALVEPHVIKFWWVNWTALALADLLAIKMPLLGGSKNG